MERTVFYNHLCNDIIPFWNKMKDNENGGFYGYADHNGIADKKSIKGVILNSRILWFYSASYQLLKKTELLEMANHAYRFLADHCLDRRNGGVFWSVSADGLPYDDTKHTYNQAFAIYALSAYYQAGKVRNALELAYSLYHIIEDNCRDKDGYLEAYTELYKADHSDEVGNSIKEIMKLFKTRIYNSEKKICNVFFDRNYNSLIDLESYGHDIEASWLIDRSCTVLGDTDCYNEMLPIINGLAQGAYLNGIDTINHAMNNECENGKVDRKKVWWVQAEAVTGFYNAYQNNPQNMEYLQIAEQIWDYITKYIIDRNSGEWIENIEADNTTKPEQPLVHSWKCPYHNGRMCIEMIHRCFVVS